MDQANRSGIVRGFSTGGSEQGVDLEVFLAGEHDLEPLPEPGDFWVEGADWGDTDWDDAA